MENDNEPIVVDEIESTPEPLDLPPTQEPESSEFTSLDIEEEPTAIETEQTAIETGRETTGESMTDLLSALEVGATQGARTLEAERDAGLPQLRTELRDITNEIRDTKKSFRRRIERIQTEGGLTISQTNAIVSDVRRKQVAQLADLEVIRAARSGSLADIEANLTRKLELQFADEQARINNLQFIFDNNKADLTAKEKALGDKLILREQRAFDLAKGREKRLSEFKSVAIQNASLAGVNNEQIRAINGAKNIDDLLGIAGKYMSSPKDDLELKKLGIDIKKGKAEYLKVMSEINAARSQINGTTGDVVTDMIAGSSRYDKDVSDTFLSDYAQAQVTLGNVQAIQEILNNGETGVLKGRAQKLISSLTGRATTASTLEEQIRRTVPGLARGIFKEVGVLTDTDINNYKQTLANATNDEDRNKLALLMTYEVIERSIGATLSSQAKGKRDVSNFTQDYIDMKREVSKLKAELGFSELTPVEPENQAKMESAWSGVSINGLTPQGITSTLDSYLNQ